MITMLLSRKMGELRVTQSELAAKTGIRPNTINDLYHNVAERVSLEQLDKICEALGCDLFDIISFQPNANKTVDRCQQSQVYKTRR